MMASVPNRPSPRQLRDAHDAGHNAGHNKDGLGGLVGAGPSKVGVDGAMRARDVARPSAQDLADAERDLVIRHAAARVESRPLPEGIAPAPVPGDRPAEIRTGKGPRPTPHPPLRSKAGESDQPPADTVGS
jgi:hypothetical protein